MDQHSKRIELKVGIFIAVGLIGAMVSILLLGGDKVFLTEYSTLRTRFNDVQGLFPGSIVSLAGVPVGNVKEINLLPGENSIEVRLNINSEFDSRLVDGLHAEIKTQGALGDKFVYLVPGPPGGPRLKEDSLIESIDTDFMKLLTSREDGVARVVDLIKELHILVSAFNANGKAAETMINMASASAKLKVTLNNLDHLLSDLRSEIPKDNKLKSALVSLSSILEKVDRGKGTLGQLVNDSTLHQNVKAFLGGSPRNTYMKDMIRETIEKREALKSTPSNTR